MKKTAAPVATAHCRAQRGQRAASIESSGDAATGGPFRVRTRTLSKRRPPHQPHPTRTSACGPWQ